jgi:hypothetical protein
VRIFSVAVEPEGTIAISAVDLIPILRTVGLVPKLFGAMRAPDLDRIVNHGSSIWKDSSLIPGNRTAMDFRRLADCPGVRGIVNDSVLAKLVATVVILIGLTVWVRSERDQPRGCDINCPTDIPASPR